MNSRVRFLAIGGICGVFYATLTAAFYLLPGTKATFMLSPVQCMAPAVCLYFGGPAIVGCSVAEVLLLWAMQRASMPLMLLATVAITLFDALPYYGWYGLHHRHPHPLPSLNTTAHLAGYLGLSLVGLSLTSLLLGPPCYKLSFENSWGITVSEPFSLEQCFAFFSLACPCVTVLGALELMLLEHMPWTPVTPPWILASPHKSGASAPPNLTERFVLLFVLIGLVIEGALIVAQLLTAPSTIPGANNALTLCQYIVSAISASCVPLLLFWLVILVFLRALERRHTQPIELLSQALAAIPQELAQARQHQEDPTSPKAPATVDLTRAISQKPFGEIDDLLQGASTMRSSLITYLAELRLATIQQERLNAELSAAAHIQQNALPHHFSELEAAYGVSISARLKPAQEVGGDLYNVFSLDTHRVCFLVGDVSGKGLPAALFMMRAQTELKETLRATPDLAEAMAHVNRALCAHNDASLFVTVFAAVLDVSTGQITYVNAGHNPPWLLCSLAAELSPQKPRGSRRRYSSRVLGFLETSSYKVSEIALKPGEGLFLFSDGVTEAQNTKEELFGTQRLENALNHCLSNGGVVPSSVVSAVASAVDAFSAGAKQFDDITMLAFCWQGEKEQHKPSGLPWRGDCAPLPID